MSDATDNILRKNNQAIYLFSLKIYLEVLLFVYAEVNQY